MNRPIKDRYYINIAKTVSERGTCSRAQVGALLLRQDSIVSTGYNGSPRQTRHCQHENDGDMENSHCARATHAEANAILNAARNGASTLGSTIYVTATPCYRCAPLLVQAGVERVVYENEYRPDERALELFREANIEVAQWRKDVGGLVILNQRRTDFSASTSTSTGPVPIIHEVRP